MDGVVHFIPGLFDHDLNYREMNEETRQMITMRSSGLTNDHLHDTSELYREDVQLISKDGKRYYLPME